MHSGEQALVVKGFNEKADSPGPYRRVSHPGVVVGCNDDDARIGRNRLERLLSCEAAYTWHPDINHRESHRMATGVREKFERLMKQLSLKADGREQAIKRFEHRRVVVDEADCAPDGKQLSR